MRVDVRQKDVYSEYCEHIVNVLKIDSLGGVPLLICGDIDEILYVDFFEKNGLKPQNVYDRNPKLHGKKCHFGQIINAEDVKREYKEIDAIVVVPYFDEIISALKEVIPIKNAFFLDVNMLKLHPTLFLPGAREYIDEHYDELAAICEKMSDVESRNVWNDILNYWISGDRQLVEKYQGRQGKQYLDFFANWSEEEYFLNCGSFDARYSKKFIELVGGKYRKIVNLECDGENYLTTCENMKEYLNVENIKTGVYKKKTVLRFNALGNGTSYITKDGQFQDTVIEVQVDTIDNIIADDDITFIKMDIEGSEYDALIGAEKTIKRCTPRMAICIYHNVFDFVRIPHLIQSYEKRYHFAVRHYTDTLCETVLYAWVED